jgi:ectoine hydroxylase-related dioxygenase (phytanoyl-CoA dioxygenase family)
MAAGAVQASGRTGWRLREDGFAVLERFLDPAVVARLRREVEACVREPATATCERPHNQLLPLRWSDRIVGLILGSAARRRAVSAVTAGEDLRWISGYVSTKEPLMPALCWHQDWWCWRHRVSLRAGPVQVAVLCYLTDTTAANGALRVLPGSHRASVPLHAILRDCDTADRSLPLDHPALSDQPGQVTIAARAGDAVVLDYRLLHGTHANRSDRRRDCVLLSFTPAWRALPVDIRAHLIRHPAQPGQDELPAAGWWAELLPRFTGRPADLALSRDAPGHFVVNG